MHMINIGYDQRIIRLINKYGSDIIQSEKFEQEKKFIQHGTTTTYTHSLCVTYISVWLAVRSRYKVDMRTVVRGALLHDYFLYDWHESGIREGLHGYKHAAISLENAKRDFGIDDKISKVIYCHMFPLNLTHVPMSREARIVCVADKMCASIETLSMIHYNRAFAGV